MFSHCSHFVPPHRKLAAFVPSISDRKGRCQSSGKVSFYRRFLTGLRCFRLKWCRVCLEFIEIFCYANCTRKGYRESRYILLYSYRLILNSMWRKFKYDVINLVSISSTNITNSMELCWSQFKQRHVSFNRNTDYIKKYSCIRLIIALYLY